MDTADFSIDTDSLTPKYRRRRYVADILYIFLFFIK